MSATREHQLVSDAVLLELDRHFDDRLLLPWDDGYGDAIEISNGVVEKYPAIVVRCRSSGDVVAALETASEHDVPFSVKVGGHSLAGKALQDDRVVIDLGPMDDVQVDAEARTARVEAGARWDDFDAAAQEHDLPTTGGVDSWTGVAGLTLGGGMAGSPGRSDSRAITCAAPRW